MVGGGLVSAGPPLPGKENMSEEQVDVASITITRTLLPNGQMGLEFRHRPPDITPIETLGMLAAAQWHLYTHMTHKYGVVDD